MFLLQIRVESQLRCYNVISSVWEEVKNHPPPNNSTKLPFSHVQAHFLLNIDKTWIISNNGNIKLFGVKGKTTTSKIMNDYKISIKIERVGNKRGSNGPMILL